MKELVSVLMDIYEELKKLRQCHEMELRIKAGIATAQEIAEFTGTNINDYI